MSIFGICFILYFLKLSACRGLKELVESKIRAGIDGLPLTTEGYSRAKGISEGEYGKTSEIVNAYIQIISWSYQLSRMPTLMR